MSTSSTVHEFTPDTTTDYPTHYVRWNGFGRGRLALAECGRLVDRYRDHANEPTCPECKRLRAEFEALEI